jgi:mannan endo-1,4-beta-mannosidase
MECFFSFTVPRVRGWQKYLLVLVCWQFVLPTARSQSVDFVVRVADTLKLGNRPFYFLGANAYYLLQQSARGDTATVKALFQRANALTMTVVRTWGFFDSSDSLNPAVIQYRPGVFNERALRALDFVIFQAKLYNIRLLIPFVNNWDDYGGMNQYVVWRSGITSSADRSARRRYSQEDLLRVVEGGSGRRYRYATTALLGHDDFYSDPIIKSWFKNYISTILARVNTYTNVRYKDEPTILGWELANEPRSSDGTTNLVHQWAREMATYVKAIDANHLLGTGEEGFDNTRNGYSFSSYGNQQWLFDGTAGTAFTRNTMIPEIDFGSCHLYPEAWGISNAAGNAWIREHIRLARSLGKPLIVGEFAAREQRTATYASWLTTALLDGAGGAIVWHLLEGTRANDGFGIRCEIEMDVCERLSETGERFIAKSIFGPPPTPAAFSLRQNYPNPFNGVTTISYSLPFEAQVNLSVFNSLGQRVATIVDALQTAGERRELLDSRGLASGAYFYTITVSTPSQRLRKHFSATMRLTYLK